MIDLRHPRAVLASRMPWLEIEARVAQVFSRKGRAGVAMPDLDLFSERVQRVAKPRNAGRARVPLRTMIALLYLKHAFNESDERVVERGSETPTWQHFSGCTYFEYCKPCDATTVVHFCQLQDQGIQPTNAFVDLGYRGVEVDNPDVRILHRGKNRLGEQVHKLLRRRLSDRARRGASETGSPHGALPPQG